MWGARKDAAPAPPCATGDTPLAQTRATPPSRVVRGARTATGATARLTTADGRLVLEGDPRIVDGPNTLTGDRITLFLDDERLECERCRLEVQGGAVLPAPPR